MNDIKELLALVANVLLSVLAGIPLAYIVYRYMN
jgi:hypothetical protein